MSETDKRLSKRQRESKSAIMRDPYDAVLLDLDGVIQAPPEFQVIAAVLGRKNPPAASNAIPSPLHGHQFPAAYQGGAFIAFHGSGAPVQAGYNVVRGVSTPFLRGTER